MTEPTTEAGRALLAAIEEDLDEQADGTEADREAAKVDFRATIIAIEREAVMVGAVKAIHFVADSAEGSRIVAADAGWDEVHEAIQAMLPYVEVARARAQLRVEIAKRVEGLPAAETYSGEDFGGLVDRAAVLALIRGETT